MRPKAPHFSYEDEDEDEDDGKVVIQDTMHTSLSSIRPARINCIPALPFLQHFFSVVPDSRGKERWDVSKE